MFTTRGDASLRCALSMVILLAARHMVAGEKSVELTFGRFPLREISRLTLLFPA